MTTLEIEPQRPVRRILTVAAIGALVGFVFGTALLFTLESIVPGGFDWVTDSDVNLPFSMVFGGGLGAIVGVIAAPALMYTLLRSVRLGTAVMVTTTAAAAGATVGLLAFGVPIWGTLIGVGIGTIALHIAHRAPDVRRRSLVIGEVFVLALVTVGAVAKWDASFPGDQGMSARIESIVEARSGTMVDFAALTPFHWTRMYIFHPYTPIATVSQAIGQRWRGPTRMDVDDISLWVFLDGDRVVAAFDEGRYVNRFGQLGNTALGLTREQAKFVVGVPATNVTHPKAAGH